MELSFNIGVKSAESRKKKRGGALENNIDSKTSNITESNSVDIKEECLVKETSFDHEDGEVFAGKNSEQTFKSLKIFTKKMLGKPLGKIDFLDDNTDDVLLNKPVIFPPSLKNLVNVSVRKFFALDINLDNIVEKSAQKKLVVVRKLFSKINGFGRAFTLSKFAGIVKAMFTSELSLVQTSKKAEEVKILVNSDLKKPSGHSDLAVVLKEIPISISTKAVWLWQKAVVEFEQIKHADLVAACWSILIRKDAVCIARSNVDKES
ncbi:hypothetical protein G9A89_006047 [Geosiphon pyriformis]|nr:hypothetical protein G9A89_006047 [Geosiphon pyriformis]